jgi:ATP-dependent Clp protease ATP-binding subunit ClpB
LDETILFKPLTKDNIGNIIDLMLNDLNERLAERELSLKITDAAKTYIMEHGYDPVYGARPLKRYLQKHVDTLVARKMLEGSVGAGDTLTVDVESDKLIVQR